MEFLHQSSVQCAKVWPLSPNSLTFVRLNIQSEFKGFSQKLNARLPVHLSWFLQAILVLCWQSNHINIFTLIIRSGHFCVCRSVRGLAIFLEFSMSNFCSLGILWFSEWIQIFQIHFGCEDLNPSYQKTTTEFHKRQKLHELFFLFSVELSILQNIEQSTRMTRIITCKNACSMDPN